MYEIKIPVTPSCCMKCRNCYKSQGRYILMHFFQREKLSTWICIHNSSYAAKYGTFDKDTRMNGLLNLETIDFVSLNENLNRSAVKAPCETACKSPVGLEQAGFPEQEGIPPHLK